MPPAADSNPPHHPKIYNPMSTDSMFTMIVQRLDGQDSSSADWRREVKDLLTDIRDEISGVKQDVASLKRWRVEWKAKVALLIFLGAGLATFVGWALNLYVAAKH